MCKYLVGILLNASTSTDENDAIDVEMQCDMLFTVASLCEGDTHRKVKLWAVIKCDKSTTSFLCVHYRINAIHVTKQKA